MTALASLVFLLMAAAPRGEDVPAPPLPAREPDRPATLGEAPVAPAGAAAAPLHGDQAVSPWRTALASGVLGKVGGRRISSEHPNPKVLLYFGGQADADWSEGRGPAARLRARVLTGGESEIFVPSDGELEAAYLYGRREFRFVLGRVEVARAPGLGLQALAQAGTLPSVEGGLSLASDTMRLAYLLAPIEAAWVRYYGAAHLPDAPGWSTESGRLSIATAARVRWTLLLPAALVASAQGELVKLWGKADLLAAAEASLGVAVLENTTLFDLGVRWNHFTRRGLVRDTSESEAELLVLATATLAF